ncbi:MAG: hypothetical protein AUI14_12320 [Actinobacteria bacterium 13_2_20CM_2_71_6]|nr:MAG: hypothetical protein AUI14_12320 [Actinobacteria bacterium 13_2_20CM_2_71_6]
MRLTMDTLATIARQRTFMTTIADAIVAAAAGKSLRVAIGWSSPDETAFADQLTRALLARGLPCRCQSLKSNSAGPDSSAGGLRGGSTMLAVITSGAVGPDETELCRINIQLRTPMRYAGSAGPVPDDEPEGQSRYAGDGCRPDILIDYLDPDGPTIRHIAPTLTPPLDRRGL